MSTTPHHKWRVYARTTAGHTVTLYDGLTEKDARARLAEGGELLRRANIVGAEAFIKGDLATVCASTIEAVEIQPVRIT